MYNGILYIIKVKEKMNMYQINKLQKGLEKAARILHPDNEISYAITKRYRELERLKDLLNLRHRVNLKNGNTRTNRS